MTLPRGLYDQLVTGVLAKRLEQLPDGSALLEELSSVDATPLLTDLIAQSLARVLEDAQGDTSTHSAQQLAIVNALLVELRSRLSRDIERVDTLPAPAQRLRAVHAVGESAPLLPATGLAEPWLFTASKASPSLYHELRTEAVACDQIDILVSFITVSGVRKLIDVLKKVTAAGASGVGRTRIRVLTTTYTGATDQKALDDLAALNGCTVKVSLDGRRTRLHAKAWIFHRRSGFGSAYVGSANLSGAALLGGLEWTVKFTEHGQAALYTRARAHFDTLWADDEFQQYDPQNEDSQNALRQALARERGGMHEGIAPSHFDITAKRYQQDILEQLTAEREHGRHRNLLVAATGTGKTVMAALDYRRTVESSHGARPRLLFVAHREEILRQAMATYRCVLRDHSFGELLAGGHEPAHHEYLFATIQSIASRNVLAQFGDDYWHTVVIDECHRMAAPQLDAFAKAVRPSILLGLTATPERTDGQPLDQYFTMRPDGSPAAELRLWHALDLQLLAPFEYFGCNDDTDFSDVPWNRPGEAEAIDKLVTGNAIRARMIVQEWRRLSGDAARSKAIVFCVSVAHAKFMSAQFTTAGLKVLCLTGESSDIDRRNAPQRLARGEICAIVTVDLYNEGVDLPDVDTLLFLRPTQSPLLFQQQLGRGLRLASGKSCCLVLDFVGQHRAEFRFDRLLSSITGLNKRELLRSVQEGFSTLPSGCHLHLESQARERVLNSLRAVVQQSWQRLKTEVQAYASLKGTRLFSLADFLHDQQIALDEVYRDAKKSGWTSLRREAGLLEPPAEGASCDSEAAMSRAMRYVLHVNDAHQLDVMRRVAEGGAAYQSNSAAEALRAQMFTYQASPTAVQSAETFVVALAREPHVLRELAELTDILDSQRRIGDRPLPGLADLPLVLHGHYQIREILTAVGWLTADNRTPFQAGVLALADRKTELLFVTLDKSKGYHDRIAYHDYAVSPTEFHWQTQYSAGPDTKAGKRYMESLTSGWRFQLFVRATPSAPYTACGPVHITSADDISGDRPMNIRWTLEVPLPIAMFREFSVLRAGE
jgi:superfamily II DNA or RNA helicase